MFRERLGKHDSVQTNLVDIYEIFNGANRGPIKCKCTRGKFVENIVHTVQTDALCLRLIERFLTQLVYSHFDARIMKKKHDHKTKHTNTLKCSRLSARLPSKSLRQQTSRDRIEACILVEVSRALTNRFKTVSSKHTSNTETSYFIYQRSIHIHWTEH